MCEQTERTQHSFEVITWRMSVQYFPSTFASRSLCQPAVGQEAYRGFQKDISKVIRSFLFTLFHFNLSPLFSHILSLLSASSPSSPASPFPPHPLSFYSLSANSFSFLVLCLPLSPLKLPPSPSLLSYLMISLRSRGNNYTVVMSHGEPEGPAGDVHCHCAR